MTLRRTILTVAVSLAALVSIGAATAHAQGNGRSREYTVAHDRAIVVTREVLVRQGYEVIRIEEKGDYQIIHYRRGNMGRGRGKGPPATMIVRRVRNRIVFENAPSAIMVDIDIRLRL